MKQRNWFIFHGDHHIGPFSYEEIMTKVVIRELNKDDLIWQEGASGWLPVHKWPEFTSLFPDAFSENSNVAEADKVDLGQVFDDLYIEEENEIEVEQEINEVFEESQFDDLPPLPPKPLVVPVEQFTPKELQAAAPTLPEDPRYSHSDLPVDFTPDLPANFYSDLPVDLPPDLPVDLLPDLPPVPTTYGEEKNDDKVTGNDSDNNEGDHKDKLNLDYTRSEENLSFQLSHLRFYVSIGIGLIGFIVFVSYLWSALSSTPRAFGLSKSNRDAIIHVSQQPFNKKILHKIRPTTDLSSLWLGSNFPGEGWAMLRLHSKVGRYMDEAPVELFAQGSYANGLTFFDEIEIVKGEGIVQGEYDYTLELIPGGKALRWNMFLKKIPVIGSLFRSNRAMGEQILKGSLLLSGLPLKEFNRKLDNYRRSLNHNIVLPLKELRQRYQTFLGLLEQMNDLYDKIIGHISEGRSIYLFEKEYNRQIGPMFRDLIIGCNRRHLSTLNINPEISEEYLILTDFGKEIGELASYMVTETKKVKRLDKAISIAIKAKMQRKVDELMKKGLNHISEINLQLKKFK